MSASDRIDQMIAALGDWRGERLAEIRALIREVDPDILEEWKWRGAPVWSRAGMVANAGAFKKKVKITFHQGAHLKDVNKLFNNGLDGNKWRAIDMDADYVLDGKKFKELVREAIEYNETHDVPKSRGSNA